MKGRQNKGELKIKIICAYYGPLPSCFLPWLKTVEYNPTIDFLLITDQEVYAAPYNLNVVRIEFNQLKCLITRKIGQDASLEIPYKLCDYKPAYGYIFEHFLKDYDYWGYCDCDLIFGNLNKLLLPLLNGNYDKIFAPGHLSLYKNTFENNRRFMKRIDDRICYKEAFTTDKIYVFDEQTHWKYNILTIFESEKTRIYLDDISFNADSKNAYLSRAVYNNQNKSFECNNNPYKIYWISGNLIGFEIIGNTFIKTEFLYCHLQNRKIRFKNLKNNYAICPDRIIGLKNDKIDYDNITKYPKKSFLVKLDRFFNKVKNKALRKKRIFYFK